MRGHEKRRYGGGGGGREGGGGGLGREGARKDGKK